MKKTARIMFLFVMAVVVFFVQPNTAVAAQGKDSELDNPIAGKLSQDDFETTKEWEAYLNEHPEEAVSVMGLWYPDEHLHVDVTKEYTIKNLPNSRVIQAFYFDTNREYLYVTQRAKAGADIPASTVLSRCKIDEETKTATVVDYMTLVGFGHGQTLDGYEHNGKTYFWTTCKANTAYDNTWGLQVGRIEYEPGKRIESYTDISRFADLAYANIEASEFGKTKRVDAALSSDGTKILFWVQDIYNNIQYSIYRTDVLNAYLDVVDLLDTKYVSFKNNYILQEACYVSFSQQDGETVLPNGSHQGIELSDDCKIYITGGNTGEIPQIAVMDAATGSYTYSTLMTLIHEDFNEYTETENIKLTHTGIYIGIVDHGSKDEDNQKFLYFLPYENIGQSAQHTESELKNVKEATCTTAGYTGDKYCVGCNEILKEGEEIPALGHTWDEGVVTKEAQAAIEGSKRFTCTRGCGTYEDRIIPATGIAPSKGTKLTKNNLIYKITKAGLTGGTVTCIGSAVPKTTVSIPKTIKDQGIVYEVTAIGASAFANASKMTKVTIGANVKAIGAKAFYKCSKLRKMTIKSTKLTAKKIGSKAFTSVYTKVKIDVPNSKKSTYKSLFRKKGLSKKATVY